MTLPAPVLQRASHSAVIFGLPADSSFVPVKSLFVITALIACTTTPGQAATVGSARMETGSASISVLAREQDVDPSTADELAEIKQRTGLTWGQLASLFEVSRRAVHSWTNGATVRAIHATRVSQLLERVRALGNMPAFKVREHLLSNIPSVSVDGAQTDREAPILVADTTPFVHQLAVKGRMKSKSG